MDLASIGQAAGGIGQLASGISSLFGGSKGSKAPSLHEQGEEMVMRTGQIAQADIKGRVAAAREAGLHPLVALGVPSASAPSFAVGFGGDSEKPDYGSALENMGQGVSRAAGALFDKAERAYIAVDRKLNLENKELQNEYIRSQIRQMNAPGDRDWETPCPIFSRAEP